MFPCAFFSGKLTPTERNYDVGNREVLAVKLALEKWRHWLVGSLEPFTVLTDYRNLEYPHTAKRLNLNQARWALFSSHFRFTVNYHPGSKNGKADMIFWLYALEEDHPDAIILPPSVLVSPVVWHLHSDLQRALQQEPAPTSCSDNRMYFPTSSVTGSSPGHTPLQLRST